MEVCKGVGDVWRSRWDRVDVACVVEVSPLQVVL